jgi:hypothetical protein
MHHTRSETNGLFAMINREVPRLPHDTLYRRPAEHPRRDADAIDGCSRLQPLRYVTLPCSAHDPTLGLPLGPRVLQLFELICVMTSGAADRLRHEATYLYRFGLQRVQLGYGSAMPGGSSPAACR